MAKETKKPMTPSCTTMMGFTILSVALQAQLILSRPGTKGTPQTERWNKPYIKMWNYPITESTMWNKPYIGMWNYPDIGKTTDLAATMAATKATTTKEESENNPTHDPTTARARGQEAVGTAGVPPHRHNRQSHISNQATPQRKGPEESVSGQSSRGQHLPLPLPTREPGTAHHEASYITGKYQAGTSIARCSLDPERFIDTQTRTYQDTSTSHREHSMAGDDPATSEEEGDVDPLSTVEKAIQGIDKAQSDLAKMRTPYLILLGMTEKPKNNR